MSLPDIDDNIFEETIRQKLAQDIAAPVAGSGIHDNHDFIRDDPKERVKWERVNINFAFAKRYFLSHTEEFEDDDYILFSNRKLLYKAKSFEDVIDYLLLHEEHEGAFIGQVTDFNNDEELYI